MCAQASTNIISPLSYSYVHAPLIARPIDGTFTERQFAPRLIATPLTYAAHAYPAPLAYAAPLHYAAPIHTPLTYAAPVIAAARLEPSYTAVNRGAVHVAPLPGHSESTSSVNLEPAPGTL